MTAENKKIPTQHLLRELHKQAKDQQPQLDAQGRPVVSAGTFNRFVTLQQQSAFERQMPNYGGGAGDDYPEFKVGKSKGVVRFVGEGNVIYEADPDAIAGVMAAENGEIAHGFPTDQKKGNGHRPSKRPRGDIRPSPAKSSKGKR